MLSSFMPRPLEELYDHAPKGCLLAALSDKNAAAIMRFAVKIGAFSLNVSRKELSASVVDEAHRRGLRVLVYTVNEPRDVARCRDLAVDGIFTDYPERTIAFLNG
jgi:glycerophosphoryl diester phosphodiesterase